MCKNFNLKIFILFALLIRCTTASIFDKWFRISDNGNDVIDSASTTATEPPSSNYNFSWGNLWNSITSSYNFVIGWIKGVIKPTEETTSTTAYVPVEKDVMIATIFKTHVEYKAQTVDNTKDAVTSGKPVEISDKPAVTSDKIAVTNDKPAVTSNKPAVTSDKPTMTTSKPAVANDKPAVTTMIIDNPAVSILTDDKLVMSNNDVSIHFMNGIENQMKELASLSIDADRKAYLLVDLETRMDQPQNVDRFLEINGMSLIKAALNNSDDRIREKAAILLGTLCENNTRVKESAYEHGLLDLIMDLYPREGRRAVRRRYLEAVTSMIRQYPLAQKKFVDLGGVQLLVKILTDRSYHKQCLQAAQLASRLLLEKWRIQELAKINDKSMENLEKLQEYEQVGFVESLQAADKQFCKRIVEFSRDVHIKNLPSHETILRTLRASIHFQACNKKDVAIIEQNLLRLNKILAEKSIADPYYNDILAISKDVLEFLKQKVDADNDDVIISSTTITEASTIPSVETKAKTTQKYTKDKEDMEIIEKLPIKSSDASKINACAWIFIYFPLFYKILSIFYF